MERLFACILSLFLALMATLCVVYTAIPIAAMGAVLLICFAMEVIQASVSLMAWAANAWPWFLPAEWWAWCNLECLLVLHVGLSLFVRWRARQGTKINGKLEV